MNWKYYKDKKFYKAAGKRWNYVIQRCHNEFKLEWGEYLYYELFARRKNTLKQIAELLEKE
jgi:hypothetical protein